MMETDSNSFVYIIRNDKNGKLYVGSTTDLSRRVTHHLSLLGHNKHPVESMQNDFNENGDGFSIATVFNGSYSEAVLLIEKLYMTLFQTRDANNGYNCGDPSDDVSLEKMKFRPLTLAWKRSPIRGDNFREWLYRARIAKGLTQYEIAKKIGITESYYSFIEKGTRMKNMDLTLATKLSDILNIPITQIVEFERKEE